jgi:hypothetical protein
MKKMYFRNIVCEITINQDFKFYSEVECLYEKDTIAYAVEHFFTHSARFTRECSCESFQIRIAKGNARRPHKFTYLIPGVLMELPGNWVRLTGNIDSVGVKVKKVELLKEHPCFTKDDR